MTVFEGEHVLKLCVEDAALGFLAGEGDVDRMVLSVTEEEALWMLRTGTFKGHGGLGEEVCLTGENKRSLRGEEPSTMTTCLIGDGKKASPPPEEPPTCRGASSAGRGCDDAGDDASERRRLEPSPALLLCPSTT